MLISPECSCVFFEPGCQRPAISITTFAASVSPATIDYFLHVDAGITVAQSITGNVLTLTLSGGRA